MKGTMKKLLFAILLATGVAIAQTPIQYAASTGLTSLSSAALAAAVQQPAATGSGPLAVGFPKPPGTGAFVYCSVACTLTISINTTLTSPANGTVVAVNSSDPAAQVTFKTAAAFTGGTTVLTYPISAGQILPLDLSWMRLGAAASNITFSIAAITGTAEIAFFPVEVH